jgi:hypothetical protein
MIKLVKVISASIQKGLRTVKVYVMGKSDVQTPHQAAPFGVDSNPVKNMVAVYASTSEVGAPVIIGYLNKDNIAESGETRLFSTDSEGVEKSSIYLKNDETIEINGNSDFMVRFNSLDNGLQVFKTALQAELVLIAAGIVSGGGTYTPSTLSVDISAAKVDGVKVG